MMCLYAAHIDKGSHANAGLLIISIYVHYLLFLIV